MDPMTKQNQHERTDPIVTAATTSRSEQSYRSIWSSLGTVAHTISWVDVNGVNTRFLSAGDSANPTVILVHGTAGSLENFAANYGDLSSAGYHVLGLDMLGCGYTDKPDHPYLIEDYGQHLLAFMDALGVHRAALVGVSLGSWVSAWVAHTSPERVAGLGLLAPAGVVVDAEREEAFARGVRARRSAAASEPTWETVTAALRGLVLDEADLIDDIVATRLEVYRQPAMQKAMPHLLAFADGGQHLSPEQWSGITVPTLVVASVDAPNMFLDNAHRIANLMPDATLWEIRGCDHWPQFERPDEMNARLIEELTRWFPPRSTS